jgi:hypothetical protein
MWPLCTLQQATVGAAILAVAVSLARTLWFGHPSLRLESLVSQALAGSSIPPALYLVACAFKPSLLNDIGDAGIYLLAASIALLYISLRELVGGEKRDEIVAMTSRGRVSPSDAATRLEPGSQGRSTVGS